MEDGKTSLRTNDDVGEDERVAVVLEQRAAAVGGGGHSHCSAAIAAAAIAADAVNSRSFVVLTKTNPVCVP